MPSLVVQYRVECCEEYQMKKQRLPKGRCLLGDTSLDSDETKKA